MMPATLLDLTLTLAYLSAALAIAVGTVAFLLGLLREGRP